MRTHIDWITFTFTPMYISYTWESYTQALADGLREMFGMALWVDVFDGNWTNHGKGRAPYADKWELENAGITLFASQTLTHACVEISGKGCEQLIATGNMEAILSACADRVTRIDVASDIETDVKPSDFVATLAHDRMRASGYQKSETGETCYVGSQKSDRYARVYRYNQPHPRSHLLRVECVFRRDYAKQVANACVTNGVQGVAASAGKSFGWSHPVWQPDIDTDVDISIQRSNRESGNTVRWLIKSCAPAFKKLVAQGIIDNPEEFFQRYFVEPKAD